MKKLILLAFAVFFLFPLMNEVIAQRSEKGSLSRCGTMERVEMMLQMNPQLKNAQTQTPPRGNPLENFRLPSIATIPVVVHIVMPNPYIITDADVQNQIDRLNIDFSGLNPDSANAAAFISLRGHSQIQFCLARRTPGGQLTNGIERRASSTKSNAFLAVDPVKRFAQGGLDVWDPTSYLNLWVSADATGALLGYAQYPDSGPAADDGVWLTYEGFGNSSCYTISQYNKGRSATHEVGHYFGLHHIWGDDGGSCTGDDFDGLAVVGSSVVLPAGLFNPPGQGNTAADVGDTPNQASETNNCPSTVALDACATTAPGKMYQNYMDYSYDACLTLFTRKQVQRMEWVLNNARAGLISSAGCQPPVGAISLDAAPLHAVNPGGFELSGCTVVNYSSTIGNCAAITPKFRIVNNGLSTLTSVSAGYIYDNGPAVTQVFAVNIPVGGTTVVSFPSFSPPGAGVHNLKFFTAAPNGGVDAVSSNDTLQTSLTLGSPASLPVITDFESTSFPPAGWTIVNPNGNFTWERKTPGRNASAGAMWINNFQNNGVAQTDDLRSSNLGVSSSSPVIISFDLAHKYSSTPDTLAVLVSTDCGLNWQTVYKKGGADLATAGSSSTAYTSPNEADWKTEVITLTGPIISSGQIMVAFRNINNYGNNIFIDNINIMQAADRDLKVVSISNPGASSCSPSLSPQVTINNNGLETITSFKVGYRIDNGPNTITTFTQTIAPGANATINLPAGTAAVGSNTITVFVADPVSATGSGDGALANDTLRKTFTVLTLANSPLVEGFEGSFPPAGWTIINPDNNVTWVKRSPGHNSASSAFFDNFNNNVIGQTDDLKTPFINVNGADSVVFSFDLAYKFFSGSADTLSILATSDCGNTYSTVYRKGGTNLATAGTSASEYLTPVASDWKTERISVNNSFTGSGHIGFAIRNMNGYGNNVFIDNINIATVYKRDLELVSINAPNATICSGSLTPAITVKNIGMETITGFKLSYTIDNSAPFTTNLNGLSFAPGSQMSVSLNTFNVSALGSHSIKIYSWDPVSTAGTGDLYTHNDTLSKLFQFAGSATAPLIEEFVNAGFPPAGWSVINPDGSITWKRNAAGNGNAGSAFVNTFNYAQMGQTDDLVTPNISFQNVDSVTLKFDLAALTYSYPGSTSVPMDTLSILVSKDCGNTYTMVYQKWGEDLQTVNDPNNPQPIEFTPQFAQQWRQEAIDLTSLGGNGPLLIVFRVSNNYENNIFIDNVNLTTRILPVQIKQQGYLLVPNPFHNSFNVWHLQQPVTMKYINVYNSVGQLVWTKQFSGNAQKVESVDLSSKAAGIYVVKIGYEDKNRNVSERILKY